jgi:hypothetical protein
MGSAYTRVKRQNVWVTVSMCIIHHVGRNPDEEDSWCDEINEMEWSIADDDGASVESAFATSGNDDTYKDLAELPMENCTMAATTNSWIPPPTVVSSTHRFPSVPVDQALLSGHGAESAFMTRAMQQRWIDSMERSQQSLAALQRLSSGDDYPFQDGHVPCVVDSVPCMVPSHYQDSLPLVVSSGAWDYPAASNRAVTPVTVVVSSDDTHSSTTAVVAATAPTMPCYSTELLHEMQVLLMHRLDESMKSSQETNPFWATANLLVQVGSENL